MKKFSLNNISSNLEPIFGVVSSYDIIPDEYYIIKTLLRYSDSPKFSDYIDYLNIISNTYFSYRNYMDASKYHINHIIGSNILVFNQFSDFQQMFSDIVVPDYDNYKYTYIIYVTNNIYKNVVNFLKPFNVKVKIIHNSDIIISNYFHSFIKQHDVVFPFLISYCFSLYCFYHNYDESDYYDILTKHPIISHLNPNNQYFIDSVSIISASLCLIYHYVSIGLKEHLNISINNSHTVNKPILFSNCVVYCDVNFVDNYNNIPILFCNNDFNLLCLTSYLIHSNKAVLVNICDNKIYYVNTAASFNYITSVINSL